jgi:hypothetical protein
MEALVKRVGDAAALAEALDDVVLHGAQHRHVLEEDGDVIDAQKLAPAVRQAVGAGLLAAPEPREDFGQKRGTGRLGMLRGKRVRE